MFCCNIEKDTDRIENRMFPSIYASKFRFIRPIIIRIQVETLDVLFKALNVAFTSCLRD